MDSIDFERLTADLAARLGELRGEDWTATADESRTSAKLAGGLARLSVRWNARTGRLSVTGLGPGGSQLGTWDISVNPERGVLAIARDISRRILNAGYLDDLLAARERMIERAAREAKRAAWLDQAAALFGIERKPHTRGPGESEHRVYLRQFVKGSGYVEAYGHGDGDTEHLSINLSGIPAQVMLGMLKVLADSVSASCCRAYGPNHHPSLSVTGCLYPDSPEQYRGEQRSRQNVMDYLDGSHGVTPYAAALALNEARSSRYDVSVIMDGERTVAVVSWDTAGLGEYTVEIPRKDATS